MTRARLVRASERTAGPPTAGMTRETAVDVDGMWAGLVRTAPGMVTGWHHHGTYETTIFVVRGVFVLETDNDLLEAGPGDFLHVPPKVVHRERNPSDSESHVIVVRAGEGETVFNVDR